MHQAWVWDSEPWMQIPADTGWLSLHLLSRTSFPCVRVMIRPPQEAARKTSGLGSHDPECWASAWDIVNTLAVTQRPHHLARVRPTQLSSSLLLPYRAHRGVGSRLLSVEYQDLGSCGADTGGWGGERATRHQESPGETSPASGSGRRRANRQAPPRQIRTHSHTNARVHPGL